MINVAHGDCKCHNLNLCNLVLIFLFKEVQRRHNIVPKIYFDITFYNSHFLSLSYFCQSLSLNQSLRILDNAENIRVP